MDETTTTPDAPVEQQSAVSQIALSFAISTASTVGCVVAMAGAGFVATKLAERRERKLNAKTATSTENEN